MQRGPRIMAGHYKSGFGIGESARTKIIPEQQDAAIC
jgi:hypothetical protein